MVLDFPNSPTNGQTYDNYYWDASTSAWRNNGSKNALSTRLTAIETANATTNLSGLVPIVPTSVNVGSGTGSVSTTGVVTFSGASNVTISGAMPAGFKTFKVITQFTASALNDVYFRYVNGTTQISSASYYGSGLYWGYNSAPALAWGASGGTYVILQKSGSLTSKGYFEISPTTSQTSLIGASQTPDNSFTYQVEYNTTTATAPDGLYFAASTGTFSGTVQIYGYKG